MLPLTPTRALRILLAVATVSVRRAVRGVRAAIDFDAWADAWADVRVAVSDAQWFRAPGPKGERVFFRWLDRHWCEAGGDAYRIGPWLVVEIPGRVFNVFRVAHEFTDAAAIAKAVEEADDVPF